MMRTVRGSETEAIVRRCVAALALTAWVMGSSNARAQLPVTDGLIVWLRADAVDTNNVVTQVRAAGGSLYVKQWADSGYGLLAPGAGPALTYAMTSTTPAAFYRVQAVIPLAP